MEIIDMIVNSVDLDKIKNLDGDLYELALSRMICIELSKYYYRDETFYLFKENLIDRAKIYNADPFTGIRNITCYSLCKILIRIMQDIYKLNVYIPTVFIDRFAHKDVILTTKNNNKYVINPLMDLIDYKVGFKTTNFASKKMVNYYKKKIFDIDYITEEDLLIIDKVIGYTKNGKYNSFDEITCDNLDDSIKIILSNKGYINGIVDLKMFTTSTIKSICNIETKIFDIYVDKDKNIDLTKLDFNNSGRYRGLIIADDNDIYLFPVENNYKKYKIDEWNYLVKKNNIMINTYPFVENMSKLKDYEIDRNILHNRQFLKVFNYYENLCKQNGGNILDFIDYSKSSIRIKYKSDLLIYIENDYLTVMDNVNEVKEIYKFIDENVVKKETIVLKKLDNKNQ